MNIGINEFHELKSRMDDFELHLQQTLNQKVNTASNIIHQYKKEFELLEEKHKLLVDQLDHVKDKEQKLENEIESHKKDADYLKTRTETYQLKKQQLFSQKTVLLDESRELDDMLAKKERELRDQRERLMRQRKRDSPEVKLYEDILGLHVDASQPGTLHFTFTNFDDKDLSRSCDLTLDISGDEFAILNSNPCIEEANEITELIDILDKFSNIPQFLTTARAKLIARSFRVQ